MKIFVGLGNPGQQYMYTRHNIGFLCLNYIAQQERFSFRFKSQCEISENKVEREKIILVKPQTFMNLSGEAVCYVKNFYKTALENIIVICDDVNLSLGTIRIREKGSAGGHNGLKNIIQLCESNEFPRIRIGVGPVPEQFPMERFVLANFLEENVPIVNQAIQKVYEIYKMVVQNKPLPQIMNEFNRKNK